MKLTKRQARYLDAINRCDWNQRSKDGTPAMRRWGQASGFVVNGHHAGDLPQRLTEAGKSALANASHQALAVASGASCSCSDSRRLDFIEGRNLKVSGVDYPDGDVVVLSLDGHPASMGETLREAIDNSMSPNAGRHPPVPAKGDHE